MRLELREYFPKPGERPKTGIGLVRVSQEVQILKKIVYSLRKNP
jgi:hypothetical protein